ncbi:hypothetical protein BDK51DRAFT_37599 [Blyttiomyces helicus]|uniref:Uncharacterized protein n=1 Tax=Blyttiomyces helicus TaxID=388810 RepID=A0A4P9WH88_9FUNG|nr:hypothetical protein BDK51DRAFT_37599 [Blyttiomyces helicus]|eukprot:RKO90768.1 hypothetical protein BDK51DRAFT_37599 [Blyttiomyces helicus]
MGVLVQQWHQGQVFKSPMAPIEGTETSYMHESRAKPPERESLRVPEREVTSGGMTFVDLAIGAGRGDQVRRVQPKPVRRGAIQPIGEEADELFAARLPSNFHQFAQIPRCDDGGQAWRRPSAAHIFSRSLPSRRRSRSARDRDPADFKMKKYGRKVARIDRGIDRYLALDDGFGIVGKVRLRVHPFRDDIIRHRAVVQPSERWRWNHDTMPSRPGQSGVVHCSGSAALAAKFVKQLYNLQPTGCGSAVRPGRDVNGDTLRGRDPRLPLHYSSPGSCSPPSDSLAGSARYRVVQFRRRYPWRLRLKHFELGISVAKSSSSTALSPIAEEGEDFEPAVEAGLVDCGLVSYRNPEFVEEVEDGKHVLARGSDYGSIGRHGGVPEREQVPNIIESGAGFGGDADGALNGKAGVDEEVDGVPAVAEDGNSDGIRPGAFPSRIGRLSLRADLRKELEGVEVEEVERALDRAQQLAGENVLSENGPPATCDGDKHGEQREDLVDGLVREGASGAEDRSRRSRRDGRAGENGKRAAVMGIGIGMEIEFEVAIWRTADAETNSARLGLFHEQ